MLVSDPNQIPLLKRKPAHGARVKHCIFVTGCGEVAPSPNPGRSTQRLFIRSSNFRRKILYG